MAMKKGTRVKVTDEFSFNNGKTGVVIGEKKSKFSAVNTKYVVELDGDIRPDGTQDKRYFEASQLEVV